MQDNSFINSLFSDKKSGQFSNQPLTQVAKTQDESGKTHIASVNPIITMNNSITQNSAVNTSPKNSPKKMSLPTASKTPPQGPMPINNTTQTVPSISLPNPANIDREKWLSLESNEIYVIRNESINKANEWIFYKLQREKYLNKRTNPFAEKTEDERIKSDMNNFRRNFTITKDLCSLLTNTKKKLQKKQDKLKKTVDNISKEVKMANLSGLKDLEIAKHYMYEMAKDNLRRRPAATTATNSVKNTEENENK